MGLWGAGRPPSAAAARPGRGRDARRAGGTRRRGRGRGAAGGGGGGRARRARGAGGGAAPGGRARAPGGRGWFEGIDLTDTERAIARLILREIDERLRFLDNVGVGYLSLDRAAATLSGGEAQRIRLATQIGSSLVGVLYILDEPSIGLHQRDNERLIGTLDRLTDLGNTVIVVVHA